MVLSCVAFNCKSRYIAGNKFLRFHRFPHSQPDVLKKWILAVRRKNWKPSKCSRLCSKHFTEDNYQIRSGSEIRWLAKDAVPTLFDYPNQVQKPVKKRRRLIRDTTPIIRAPPLSLNTCHQNSVCQDNITDDREVSIVLPSLQKQESITSEMPAALQDDEALTTSCSSLLSSVNKSFVQSPTELALRKKIRLLQATLRRRDKQIESMTDLITTLKKKGDVEDNLIFILKNNFR